MDEFYNRNTCRLCGSDNLYLVLSLGKSPLCDAYLKTKKEQCFYDLDLYCCNVCKFVQLSTIINPEIIYRDYIYVTTSSTGLTSHFEQYCEDVASFLDICTGYVVDIGSNEGTLLAFFKNKGFNVLGIEPSIKASSIANANGIETVPEFFDKKLALEIVNNYGYANIITINNLYANIDDLYTFTEAVDLLLNENGILVIESSYLLDMLNNMVFDFIYHEHLSYFSIMPLITFFKKFDMKLINLQRVSTKGGSMRYFFAKNGSKFEMDSAKKLICNNEMETNIGSDLFSMYSQSIQFLKNQIIDFLKKNIDKKAIGYGASATSTTLISYFGLSNYLEYLVDDNEAKQNTFSPGYHIPVYNPSVMAHDNVDIIVILAWRFKDEIINKIGSLKVKIVIPLPNFLVVDHGI